VFADIDPEGRAKYSILWHLVVKRTLGTTLASFSTQQAPWGSRFRCAQPNRCSGFRFAVSGAPSRTVADRPWCTPRKGPGALFSPGGRCRFPAFAAASVSGGMRQRTARSRCAAGCDAGDGGAPLELAASVSAADFAAAAVRVGASVSRGLAVDVAPGGHLYPSVRRAELRACCVRLSARPPARRSGCRRARLRVPGSVLG
jgi:hypothetical protein